MPYNHPAVPVPAVSTATVFVLDHAPLHGEPVYHESEECSMVAYERPRFVEVPRWVVEIAGIRRCRTNGACQEDER